MWRRNSPMDCFFLFLLLLLRLLMLNQKARLKESTSMSWSKMNALSVARRVTILIAVILLPISLTSCGRSGSDGEKKTTQKSEDDFLDKHAKPEERKYLVAAKPFFIAVANRKYADAYALLQPCEGSHVAQSICACSARCRFSAE